MDVIKQISAVAVVLSLLSALLWLLKRRGPGGIRELGRGRARRLECVERVALGPHHAVHLIRLGERGLLVASSPSGCALMQSFAWREFDGAGEPAR